jgi:hypothetical protein
MGDQASLPGVPAPVRVLAPRVKSPDPETLTNITVRAPRAVLERLVAVAERWPYGAVSMSVATRAAVLEGLEVLEQKIPAPARPVVLPPLSPAEIAHITKPKSSRKRTKTARKLTTSARAGKPAKPPRKVPRAKL